MRQRASALAWAAQNLLAVNGIAVDVTGDRPADPGIYVGRAERLADIIALVSVVPGVIVASDDVEAVSFAAAAGVNAIVLRHGDDPVDKMSRARTGLMSVSARTGVPIVPVHVQSRGVSLTRVRRPAWREYLELAARSRTHVTVSFGRAITPGLLPSGTETAADTLLRVA